LFLFTIFVLEMKKNISIKNRKVKHEYIFLDAYIAGIQLFNAEIKSIRNSEVSMNDAYCYIQNREIFVKHMFLGDVRRDIKLLLKKSEIDKINKKIVKGVSVLAYELFINEKGFAKLHVIVGKGKSNYDKRISLKEKEIKKDIKNLEN
jgi:SsrA-binding protein